MLGAGLVIALLVGNVQGDQPASKAPATFQQYCFTCHGKAATAGLNLQELSTHGLGDHFQEWQKVVTMLEEKRMPPKGMPQPTDEQRTAAITWIRSELDTYAKKNDGNPGEVTVRRLTSGEYAYTVQDLTGLNLDLGIDATTDSVGGEGFTNFGDVQFMHDASLERYLHAAKQIADHAVIGAGPVSFYIDPGKTGFELAALNKIRDIYSTYGFRTVSGEGGRPFGLDLYGRTFYVAWQYLHRKELGMPNATLDDLAVKEKVTERFAEHIWSVLNDKTLGFPSSDVAERWRKLPAPGDAKVTEASVRAECEMLQTYLATWPSWLFARGDVAAGGAGDESPLVFNDETLKAEPTHHFRFAVGGGGRGGRGRGGPQTGPKMVYLHIASVNPKAKDAVVIWHNPRIALLTGAPRGRGGFGGGAGAGAAGAGAAAGAAAGAGDAAAAGGANAAAAAPARRGRGGPATGPAEPLKSFLTPEDIAKLNFGKSPDGTEIAENEFATAGTTSFEVKLPEGAVGAEFQADVELGKDQNGVMRIIISDREDGKVARGQPTRALLGDETTEGYKSFRAGVMQLATLWPPNSHGEANPADKDPVPEPFDNTYNTPEHDAFVMKVKYQRSDEYLTKYILNPDVRKQLNDAWNDLYASFEYHDAYLGMLTDHYHLNLKTRHVSELTDAEIAALPAEPRKYIEPLREHYREVMKAELAGQSQHLDNCIDFAALAWRRPLTAQEKDMLRSFYTNSTEKMKLDHVSAIRALLARILVAPQFLYRIEPVGLAKSEKAGVETLSNWEIASRLSYFLWSSMPDAELRRAAEAGELNDPAHIRTQVKRMMADPKARRMSTEFFGQWLGFYHFDQFRGVDTTRFPEFTDEVKSAMYDEAVSFFEHLVRDNRPVKEMLNADYTFLNKDLAKFYGVKKDVESTAKVEEVDGANAFQRGGMLRLGAVLTVTSAPLRTSPVKRGDWILRRVLGTPTPPPPANAGSIPADAAAFGGMSIRERLQVHKRNATCATCHTRIDPLGFPLEHFDSMGRWRDNYSDGKVIEDNGEFADNSQIVGVKGLLDYLNARQPQVVQTLSKKMIGYALGRTYIASDQPLVDKMAADGGNVTFVDLAADIAASPQFRTRLGREDSPTATVKQVAATRDRNANEPEPKNSEKAGGE